MTIINQTTKICWAAPKIFFRQTENFGCQLWQPKKFNYLVQLHKILNPITIMWQPNPFSVAKHNGGSSSVMKSFHALILTNVTKKSRCTLT
jgi:hypothetical protein